MIFHFNKKHLEDPTIPMWVIKAKGESYYVEHVSCSVPWTTKETPDSTHTKGSLKAKHCFLYIDENNHADIRAATAADKLKEIKKNSTRIITSAGDKLKAKIQELNLSCSPVKTIGGSCSTSWFMCDVYLPSHFSLLSIAMSNNNFRVLKPNEHYYDLFDATTSDHIDLDLLDDMYDGEDPADA